MLPRKELRNQGSRVEEELVEDSKTLFLPMLCRAGHKFRKERRKEEWKIWG